ncbi:hypothetical protein K9M79_06785 [Candidatus Woesearchaeota archaeon]|nr:hypothetical protein [Candidatus Woesearchaeota archaeon]
MKNTYEAKSVIIGRKKKINDELKRPCFISLFDVNDPHKSGEVPKKIIDAVTYSILINGLNVKYLLPGNDIVINNLRSVTIEHTEKGNIRITGEQES